MKFLRKKIFFLFTSGESIYESFRDGHFMGKYAIGKKYFVIDTISNEEFLSQLGLIKTKDLEKADFILDLDIFKDEEGVKAYTQLLKR